MRNIAVSILLFMLLQGGAYAQVGINTVAPDSASVMDIYSNKAGLLIPRASFGNVDTEIQAKGYTSPLSMLIFDLDLNRFLYVNPTKKWSYLNMFDISEPSTGLFLYKPVRTSYTLSIGDATDICNIQLNGRTTIKPADTLHIDGNIKANDVQGTGAFGGGLIPKGGIIMWSGDPNNLPDGWALCDGSKVGDVQTPDLRGRFIVGYNETTDPNSTDPNYGGNNNAVSSEYSVVGNNGGTGTHTLVKEELPLHQHTVGTGDNATLTNGAHTHSLKIPFYQSTNQIMFGDPNVNPFPVSWPTALSSEKNYTTSGDGAHTHTGVTGNGHSDGLAAKPFDVRPRYYVLAFIIRIK